MLSPRTETILKSIVGQYIVRAAPVPSQSLMRDHGLEVSSATIRSEMARLERDGYITRPHPSAGGVPSDRGYRYYVECLEDVKLPLTQQYLVDHVFHQVETKLEEWLRLAATLLAHLTHNMAMVVMPRATRCQFKHLELVSLQPSTALLILVMHGARLRQQLVSFDRDTTQAQLTAISNKLNATCADLSGDEIAASDTDLPDDERRAIDSVVSIMRAEVQAQRDEPYLDGLHFMLDQPEFADGRQGFTLVELTEQRNLRRLAIPTGLPGQGVKVIIGAENEAEEMHDYSIVASRYGLPEEAVGAMAIIGPTRMPYGRTIAAIDYLSWLLSSLIARLYGREDTDNQARPHA